MKTDILPEWHRLFNAALNDQLSDAERAELATVLKSSAEARQLWFLYQDNECSLAELKPRHAAKSPRTGLPWLSWRPLTAAAAGIAVGMFCTSVVYGFVLQRGQPDEGTPVTFTSGGFEADVVLAADFVPTRTGLWSGDFTALSEGELGITPPEGSRMVKFLRTDNRLSPAGFAPSASELWQVVDLASMRTALGRELSVIEVSAQFNHQPGAVEEKLAFGVSAMAFSGSAADAPTVWREHRELALARADKEELADAEPLTWQRISAQMTVPREANLLLVQLRVVRKGKGPHSPMLGAQFADAVQLRALNETPTIVAVRR